MKPRFKQIAGIAGAMVLAGVIGASLYDWPAPEINYTYRDLAVPEEVAASYSTLMLYRTDGTNRIDALVPDDLAMLAGSWTDLRPHADRIEQAWTACADGRRYVQELDRFPFITDWNNPRMPPEPSRMVTPDYRSLRQIALLYNLHAVLMIQQGETEEGLREISQHYSVVRKSLPYSTALVTFAINMACARQDIQTADHCVRHAHWTPDQLQRFRTAFPPLTREHLSWFRPLLAEYAYSQFMVTMLQGDLVGMEAGLEDGEEPPRRAPFKPNLTMRTFKRIYEPLIRASMQRTDLRPVLRNVRHGAGGYGVLNRVWNPSGRELIGVMTPIWDNVFDKTLELQAMSDLLYLEIRSRQGEIPELKDSYTGAAYRYDRKLKRFYCVGPDGLDGTRDDLYINPPES